MNYSGILYVNIVYRIPSLRILKIMPRNINAIVRSWIRLLLIDPAIYGNGAVVGFVSKSLVKLSIGKNKSFLCECARAFKKKSVTMNYSGILFLTPVINSEFVKQTSY